MDEQNYTNEFNELSKSLEVQDIKHMNRLFPELTLDAHLSIAFYNNFEEYLKEFLKKNFRERAKLIKYISYVELNWLKHMKQIYKGIKERSNPISKKLKCNII